MVTRLMDANVRLVAAKRNLTALRTAGVDDANLLASAESAVRAAEQAQKLEQEAEKTADKWDCEVDTGLEEGELEEAEKSEGGYVAPPSPGRYLGELWRITTDSGKGHVQYKFHWRSIDEHAPGARAALFTDLTPDAAWKFFQTLKSLGIKYQRIGGRVRFNDPTKDGTTPMLCVAEWEFKLYKGEVQKRIQNLLGPQTSVTDSVI